MSIFSVKSIKAGLLACAALAVTLPTVAAPSGMTPSEVDTLVESAMERFQVPGISVGIIKDGKVIVSKGYGIRDVGKKDKVDDETLFAIASNSKAFTAAALAMLVDEGKVKWSDKVIDYIPGFQLMDPWVTREFTVLDLLVHNSGLGLGAGDLMFWPSPGFTRDEIIHGLRYLKPVSSFRSEFAYDNLLYIVAGEVIKAASGMEYETFIENRIMKPLGMTYCAAERARLKGYKNVAEPHMVLDGELKKVGRIEAVHETVVSAAAGGFLCSSKSMLKWLQMRLDKGALPNGTALISPEQQNALVTPRTLLGVSAETKKMLNTNFKAYALGLGVQDVNGYKWVTHTGGLLGMVSYVYTVPELDLGVVILTNQQSGGSMSAIAYGILEAYTSEKKTDWVSYFEGKRAEQVAAAAKVEPVLDDTGYTVEGSLDDYTGTFKDPWFGTITIANTKDGLTFVSAKSARLKGVMVPYKHDLFIVRWDERDLEADAYVRFTRDYQGVPQGITMQAVSPLTDFSFDFHDLEFTKVAN
ncbi:serine hydrolase [Kordiimonas pumila]|uniref:Serine hydrolase n=1 Tax=Kordiimonas pumila TaxID=2161677 RepID=A0ABV7D3N7_9PROT|nr:serine hydrolase [Kordiimonas pumila]